MTDVSAPEEDVTLGGGELDDFSSIRERYEAGKQLTDEEMDKIADLAVGYLKSILALFGETSSSIDEYDGENGELILDVNGGDLAVLIGRHGRTLDALQMVLTSLLSSRIKFYYPVVVDIESYKNRRKRKLEDIALSSAARAKQRGGKVTLSPMNAYERRIIHLALRNDEGVVTHSEGVDPERRVVITAVR
ncbi:protein jag [Thermophilibacter provencensis]|uniref:R3H domain-containing nucleic acid-binding protein n=1 Tax=Thermophilibacter provencensis TaxID=1852386 RepID=A0ABT7V2J1_9ACTN|nr:R3H domain-containing nucleic acid-binding protein [Thermophilibacter provencensis]MDM8270817.1 R3H domain-containing nucleic acid-binding protein [Thermophilibacter provencensis]